MTGRNTFHGMAAAASAGVVMPNPAAFAQCLVSLGALPVAADDEDDDFLGFGSWAGGVGSWHTPFR